MNSTTANGFQNASVNESNQIRARAPQQRQMSFSSIDLVNTTPFS
jgi:hypothetical protein